MLSSLRRTVSQIRSFNGGNSTTYSLCIIRFSSSSPNCKNPSHSSSFVVDYLIKECGLSENQAIAASKKINFKTSSNPDSVLNLLQDYGFTEEYISKTITKFPSVLLYDPQKTLQPKFDFFNSKGISGLDLAKFISGNTGIIYTSLHHKIIPHCDILKKIVHTDNDVVAIIRQNSWLLMGNLGMKSLLHNIEFLRNEGVPLSNVSKFVIEQPRALAIGIGKFEEIVQQIKHMGFDPSEANFVRAIQVLACMTRSTWETKLNAYRRWGWSEDEIRNAFKYEPMCMRHSEKKIMSTMDYLVNRMGYNPLAIAKWPVIFNYSLEKRIIPRCVVIQFLLSTGQIKDYSLCAIFASSEKSFLEKFVSKYEVDVPELLKVYQTALSRTYR